MHVAIVQLLSIFRAEVLIVEIGMIIGRRDYCKGGRCMFRVGYMYFTIKLLS